MKGFQPFSLQITCQMNGFPNMLSKRLWAVKNELIAKGL